MREDGVDVYIRHRDELLKSIYDGTDAKQEAGDFLLSTLNLQNQGIEYDLLTSDMICLSYSNHLLQKEVYMHPHTRAFLSPVGTGGGGGGTGKEGEGTIPHAKYRPALMSTYGTAHPWVDRIKQHWTADDDDKHGYSFHKPRRKNTDKQYDNEEELHHSYQERNLIPASMKHALWPEAVPHTTSTSIEKLKDDVTEPASLRETSEKRLAEHYVDKSPYDEKYHPMRRIRADTGMPEWENSLHNLYFNGTLDDGPSYAEELMGMEDKHKEHWGKRTAHSDHGVYKGIDGGQGKRSLSFFGGGDEGHESDTKHLHTLRLRDFKRWKNPVEGTEWDKPGHKERVAKLDEEGADMEKAHFNDRMRKLNSHDVMPIEYDPKTGLTDEEVYRELIDNDIPTDTFTDAHGHGMGWPTWNFGMEFLSPEERTLAYKHLDQFGSDNSKHQSITLEDGQRLHMSRLKKTADARMTHEANWFVRKPSMKGGNKNKHIETPTDTLISGDEGMVSNALKNTYLKDGLVHEAEPYNYDKKGNKIKMFDETAHEMLQRNIGDSYEGEKLLHYSEEGDTNLFPFSERDVKDIQKKLDGGKNLKKALKGKITHDSDVPLSLDGLHRLVGYNKDLTAAYEKGEYPIFKGQQEPFLDTSIMKRVLKNYERATGVANSAEDIRNAYGAARQAGNGPDHDDIKLRSEEKEHYFKDGGKLRGWGYPTSRPLTHVGGLGRQATTQAEILHDFLSLDGGKTSMMGSKHKRGGGEVIPESDSNGLFHNLHPDYLPSGQTAHNTALGILSKWDTNVHSQTKVGSKQGKGRNVKTNSSDFDTTRSPEYAKRVEYGNPSEKDYTMNLRGLRRGIDQSGFHEDNPFTKTSAKRYVSPAIWNKLTEKEKNRYLLQGEVSMRNAAGMSHMFATANGRINPPHDPAERSHYSFEDMASDKSIHSSQDTPMPDFLQHLPTAKKTSTVDKLPDAFFDDLNNAGEMLSVLPEGKAKERYQEQYDKLKAQYNEVYIRSMSTKQGSKGWGWRKRNDDAMMGDKRGVAQYATTVLKPLIEKEHPDAFHPDNPKALANTLRMFRDAQRGLAIDPNHDIKTSAMHVREGEAETASDKHYTIANVMQHMTGNELHPNTPIEKALEMLDLPNDTAHREHVRDFMKSLHGPVNALSLGKLASLGIEWNNNDPEMFAPLTGTPSLHEHMDSAIDGHQLASPKQADYERKTEYNIAQGNHDRDFKLGNSSYNALNWLHHVVRASPSVMDNYALSLHTSPQPKSGKGANHQQSRDGRPLLHPSAYKSGLIRDNNDKKDIASHILSFDPNRVPEGGLQANTPAVEKEEMGFFHDVPIRPLDSHEGALPHDHYSSDTMNWGYERHAEVGVEYDWNGTPSVGTQTVPEDYHSVQRPFLSMVHPDVNAVLSNEDVKQQQSSEQTRMGEFGQSPSSDMLDVNKADLPKAVPLIEPLHRIFDVKDIGQLKGFTGEWVVSVYKDGVRCKVTKKKNRITILNDKGEKQSVSDDIRNALRSIGKKDYVVDGVLVKGELFINDILLYDKDDVTDLSTRERIKVLRGQFDSFDPVYIPSPSDIRITDEVGLEGAVKQLSEESKKILLRDAKSTYMKGEEKHPKWILLAKSDVLYHVPFSMEIDDSHFILHLPEDVVKYEIVDDKPTNPMAAIGSISDSDYSIRLASNLEPYWEEGFGELLKEETEIEPEMDEERIEEESVGILRPKKDKNLILKPKDFYKALLLIEEVLDKMEKGFTNLSGRGLGIDVGGGIMSPRGPTTLDSEQALPDWDMKKRPTEDSEKAEDYPGRDRKKRETEAQYNELAERSLEG